MIGKDTMQVTLTKPFSFRERVRVLFGSQLMMTAAVEVTAKGILKSKEVKISYEMKGTQAYFGKPIAQPALPQCDAPPSLL